MIKSFQPRRLLLLAMITHGMCCSAQVVIPRYESTTNSLLSSLASPLRQMLDAVNQEVTLARSLFADTNRVFDHEVVARALHHDRQPILVSFKSISFLFSYPSSNSVAPSYCEAGLVDDLLSSNQVVIRKASASTNEIPTSYVRVFAPRQHNPTADVDLILGVAPLANPEDLQYVRQSFRFVYRDGWREVAK